MDSTVNIELPFGSDRRMGPEPMDPEEFQEMMRAFPVAIEVLDLPTETSRCSNG